MDNIAQDTNTNQNLIVSDIRVNKRYEAKTETLAICKLSPPIFLQQKLKWARLIYSNDSK